jgi:hypothetical protein
VFLALVSVSLWCSTAYGQLSHLDSLFATVVREEIFVAAPHAQIVADSSFVNILPLFAGLANGSSIFHLEQAFGVVVGGADTTRLRVTIAGSILDQSPVARPWSITTLRELRLTQRDQELLETHGSRYVHMDSEPTPSFWESALEPALVLLGAGLIVALFFLIRS